MTWVGVDVGGTFTDLVSYDAVGNQVNAAKCLSTPDDPIEGILNGLDRLGVDLGTAKRFVHGTTRVTNALLEGRFARVALITTRGFRDVIEMARGHRARLYSVKEVAPTPLVPRTLRFEVPERMRADGSVETPLDLEAVRQAAADAAAAGAEALAVCFLHSYANPAHETAAADLIRREFPSLACTTSAGTVAEIGEFERFATTVLNAAVKSGTAEYLGALDSALKTRGFSHRPLIMTSSGGVISVDRAHDMPIQLALSGPAGGVSAAAQIANRGGYDKVITCDMGGTSTDVCLIRNGLPAMTSQGKIGDWPSKIFQVEIETIGAGGGSVAWRDIGGELVVGPRSAGSSPGPACYGRGGTEPTITDAHLLVGHLSTAAPLGSEVALDPDPASAAFGNLARAIGDLSVEELARGVIRLGVVKMTSAIKAISVARGHDPRDFALMTFGGAGPMHGTMLARELGIATVIVPPVPGNLSALGFISAQARQDVVRAAVLPADEDALRYMAETLPALEADARERLIGDGVAPDAEIRYQRALGLRIKGQSHDLHVPVTHPPSTLADLRTAFEDAYTERYAYKPAASDLELVTVRVTALGPPAEIGVDPHDPASDRAGGERAVYTADGWADAAVRWRGSLDEGETVTGPAVIEESGSTTVVEAGWHARVDDRKNLILSKAAHG